jgi:hypothetical protein
MPYPLTKNVPAVILWYDIHKSPYGFSTYGLHFLELPIIGNSKASLIKECLWPLKL